MNYPSSSRGSIFSPTQSLSRTATSSVFSPSQSSQIAHATFKSVCLDINASDQDYASVTLYARISVPTNTTGSQQPVILFQERNLTLRHYEIHPLDSSGRPYAYPPESSPLIQRAGRVLRLGEALDEYYSAALERSILRSPTRRTTPARNTSTGLGSNSLGSITVQNRNFAFLTPRYGLRMAEGGDRYSDGTVSEGRGSARRKSFSATTPNGRASSKYRCIIAMELSVPIVNMPDISPYMLSMPVPKCLDNKVRVALPKDHEWVVFSRPHILDQQVNTINAESWGTDGFDDEGYAEEDMIKGTYQSSDKLIIRWSPKPDEPTPDTELEKTAVPSPAKRSRSRSSSRSAKEQGLMNLKRASLSHVIGHAKYTVHPVHTDHLVEDGDQTVRLVRSVPLDIEYDVRCVGIHHSGTETQVGIDLVLSGAKDEQMEADWNEAYMPGHSRTGTAGTAEEDMWSVPACSVGIKAWNALSTQRSRRADQREHSPSPRGGAGRTAASLQRTDTVVTEASSSGSSGPSLGQRRLGSVGGYGSPAIREPLPRGEMPDEPSEDFLPGEVDGLDGSLIRRSVTRTSSDPHSSTSSIGRAVSRQSSGTDTFQSQGSFTGSDPGSEFTNASAVESLMASPQRPRTYSPYLPSDPLVFQIDILDVLDTKPEPNPSMADFSFTIKGHISVRLPDETPNNTDTIPFNLPMFRFPGAHEQTDDLSIKYSTEGRGQAPFEVFVDRRRIDPGPHGFQAKDVVVASPAQAEADVILAFSRRALDKAVVPQSNSLMDMFRSSLGLPPSPRTPGSPTLSRSLRPTPKISMAHSATGQGLQGWNPASSLQMPSPSTHADEIQHSPSRNRTSRTPIGESSHRLTAWTSESDPPSSLAWAEVKVLVKPPSLTTQHNASKDSNWSYVVHVRSSWPSVVGGGALLDSVEFGLPKLNSSSTEATPQPVIKSVHVGDTPAIFEVYDNRRDGGIVNSQELAPFAEKSGNEHQAQGTESKWISWTKVKLPSRTVSSEGNMEIIYEVATNSKASRKANIDVLLPSFTIGVARMTVDVDVPADFTRRSIRTSLQSTSNTVESFRDFNLRSCTRSHLSLTLSKQYFVTRLMSTPTFQVLHFLLTASALFYIWLLHQGPQHPIPGSFSEAAFSPLAKLVEVTLSVTGKKPVSSMGASPTTVSSYSASPTRSIARRPPKETYVPPDNLWGTWDSAQVDPFPAVSEDPLETRPDDPIAIPAGPTPSDPADPAIPLNLRGLGTFTHLIFQSDKYQQGLIRIVRDTVFQLLSLLVALFH
ncbi:hypothetical protein FRB90_012112 [Tulasnella sp. 427]|nr:hypothetical protein FRB90_012112 [Tulasnella sp. 427]